jgi:hypothetical protein
VQQHLQRLDGVAKVEVSLLDGRVSIAPKPGAALDPARILKATYDSGVSVVEMAITASGSLAESAGKLVFRTSARQAFVVNPGALMDRLKPLVNSGRDTKIRGRIYQLPRGAPKPKEPPSEFTLDVLDLPGGGFYAR